jgi:hypothetical protein
MTASDFKTTVDFKNQAKRLRDALAQEGLAVSHGKALDIVAWQNGARDWNTLAASAARVEPTAVPGATPDPVAVPFQIGQAVAGTFNGNPAKGRVIGLEETIKPDLWRVTVAFNPPVDASTSDLFKAERRRVTMVVGADGKSRRLTGTETGVMALAAA